MSHPQRRAHERYAIALGAEVHTAEHSFSAETRDISLGGASIRGPHSLAEGSFVELALYVVVDGIEEADFPPLEVRAQVQWIGEADDQSAAWRYIAGLRFDGISLENRQWLERVLTKVDQ